MKRVQGSNSRAISPEGWFGRPLCTLPKHYALACAADTTFAALFFVFLKKMWMGG
ncbi:MAG: hypothetical protein JWR09_411 [Mucilaginibacter sp.]|nr:hypothetical protein [Mucilaginibacter sp.]